MAKAEYVLSPRDQFELERLKFQHEVWREETESFYHLADILSKERVLEIGCGPGYVMQDLLQGELKEYLGVDTSELFTQYINHHRSAASVHIKTICGDFREEELPKDHFDACFIRWVLMFIDKVDIVLKKAFDSLRTGGVFAIMEYGPFLDIGLTPKSVEFNTIYEGVYRLLQKFGGDPDIGLKLPEMLKEVGFNKVEFHEVKKSGNTRSDLWDWIVRTSDNHPNLVENGLITEEELNEYNRVLTRVSGSEEIIFSAPAVQQIIAVK